MMRALVSAGLALGLGVQTALASCAADAVVVFDASVSMNSAQKDGPHWQRIDAARAAMADALPRVERVRRLGLVTYGPGGSGACDGVRLGLPPMDGAAAPIMAALDGLEPEGLTPLTDAVAFAAGVLDYRTRPGIIVLVTDGNESCGGAPCAVAEELMAAAADLTIHVIGFQVVWDAFASGETRQDAFLGAEIIARCMADQSGGVYAAATSTEELVAALERTLGCLVIGRLE